MEKSVLDALREVPVFSDLSEEQLQWFASNSEEVRAAAGEIFNNEGDPAEWLSIVLDGEVRIQRESAGPDALALLVRSGEVTGLLPFSRMTHIPATIRALVPTRTVRLHKQKFPEMFEKVAPLVPRLVGLMSDRIREVSRLDQQRDKLTALGKLSAGLAHELNNPASAARRASESLKEAMARLRESSARAELRNLTLDQCEYLTGLERSTFAQLCESHSLDTLEQSDREDEITAWLEAHGVKEAWKISPPLVEAGFQLASVEEIAAKLGGAALEAALQRFTAGIAAEKLVREIESSTGRISDLVKAIKEYSYMDQNPEHEIDIHKGIDSTLTMLKFRLKHGIQVIREYDPALPRLCAHGGELNQVWTNLIDNAADAMNGKGELRIKTRNQLDRALIEIIDSGPGISPEIKDRIFDPFFTTKGVGEGTGLGLDTVYRIVRSHHGEIKVDSRPGQTRFQVWLPYHKPKEDQP